jgi:hypothetical protein
MLRSAAWCCTVLHSLPCPMKQYKRVTVNLPQIFVEVLEKRIEEAGPFSGDSAFFMSLFLFDIQARRKHSWTAKIMSLPPRSRDELFAQLAEDYLAGKKLERKTWLDHRLNELVNDEIARREAKTKATELTSTTDDSK